jgi:hypothetical protein
MPPLFSLQLSGWNDPDKFFPVYIIEINEPDNGSKTQQLDKKQAGPKTQQVKQNQEETSSQQLHILNSTGYFKFIIAGLCKYQLERRGKMKAICGNHFRVINFNRYYHRTVIQQRVDIPVVDNNPDLHKIQ